MNDRIKNCITCHHPFTFTVNEQEYYKKLGYKEPINCQRCRKERRLRKIKSGFYK
jgi:hypothetical protein